MAVSSVAPSVSALTGYVAGQVAAAKARGTASFRDTSASSVGNDAANAATLTAAQNSSQQASVASRVALPAAPTALELAVTATFELERLAARGNMQAQRILDRREGLSGLSARPTPQFELSSAPERNVPQSRSAVFGTRIDTWA